MDMKAKAHEGDSRFLALPGMVFLFAAFLLLGLKDFAPLSFVMAVMAPACFFAASFILPRLIPADKLLQMATIRGAAALGRGETAGSLQPGRPADLAVVALPGEPGERSPSLPEDLLLQPASRIARTMLRGRWT